MSGRYAGKAARVVLHAVLGVDGVRAFAVEESNYSDPTIREFVEERVVPLLREGEVVIMDRWGQGRSLSDDKFRHGHNNPYMRRAIYAKGCHHVLLPPKGCLLDPIEVLFSHMKRWLDPFHDEWEGGVMGVEDLKLHINNYFMEILTPELSKSFFQSRADGKFVSETLGLEPQEGEPEAVRVHHCQCGHSFCLLEDHFLLS